MRKYQQKQILTLIKTIEQAQSAGLYADCQEGAVSIGNFIESIEGEGAETVALLEEYCELLFKASKGEIKEKQLRKHLIKIENSVMFDLKPNRIEMVFLLYKASMSDSLESIYLAAKDDPDCDAYWIPLPYYDLNADRSLGTMYYEGASHYGKNIMCTDWRSYNIVDRHPDVIFTHYAYDDNVNNASIHPDFYSKRLREHCELLVYVPYFITVVDTVDEYCGYLPGVLYADHVIVESEPVRQSYIEHYKRFDKEFSWNGQFGKAEKKFLALGSPKLDKVISTKREDCELFAEWERMIYKPDGSRKKIILYNTHMFKWINGGAAYFKKLRSVFDLFRSRDDVVLWWRPHPNTELNFRIKRPEWFDEYRRIVSEYVCGSWGIYDDTPDLHRAIAISDAYYGDWSSLVTLYKATGKPIMMQNTDVIESEDVTHLLRFTQLVSAHGCYWFTALDFNGLFKMDKQTFITEYVGAFPFEKRNIHPLFMDMFAYGGCLYFAPYNALHFARYNIAINEFQIIEAPIEMNSYGNFGAIYNHGDFLYCIPENYPAIIKINLVTGVIDKIDNWINQFRRFIPNTTTSHGGMFGRGIILQDKIYLPMLSCDVILEFNMESDNYKFIEIEQHNGGSNIMVGQDDELWLFSSDKPVITRWNSKTGETTFFDSFPKSFKTGKPYNFGYAHCVDGYIFAYSSSSNMSLKISMTTGEISQADDIISGDVTAYYSGSVDNNIYFNETRYSKLTITGNSGQNKTVKHINLRDKDIEKIEFDFSGIVSETPTLSLQMFLDYISVLKQNRDAVNCHSNAGQAIYNYTKSLVMK